MNDSGQQNISDAESDCDSDIIIISDMEPDSDIIMPSNAAFASYTESHPQPLNEAKESNETSEENKNTKLELSALEEQVKCENVKLNHQSGKNDKVTLQEVIKEGRSAFDSLFSNEELDVLENIFLL